MLLEQKNIKQEKNMRQHNRARSIFTWLQKKDEVKAPSFPGDRTLIKAPQRGDWRGRRWREIKAD